MWWALRPPQPAKELAVSDWSLTAANKCPLCPSYLMGLAPLSATWTAARPWNFFFFPSSSSFFFASSSPAVCVFVRERVGEMKRKHLCWPTCSQCHFHGAVCCSSVVLVLSRVSRHPLCPSLLRRHIKWLGRSSNRWIQTTPRTTTELSRNQWVSGGSVQRHHLHNKYGHTSDHWAHGTSDQLTVSRLLGSHFNFK